MCSCCHQMLAVKTCGETENPPVSQHSTPTANCEILSWRIDRQQCGESKSRHHERITYVRMPPYRGWFGSYIGLHVYPGTCVTVAGGITTTPTRGVSHTMAAGSGANLPRTQQEQNTLPINAPDKGKSPRQLTFLSFNRGQFCCNGIRRSVNSNGIRKTPGVEI